MTHEEAVRRIVALTAAAHRRDREGMSTLLDDLTLDDAKILCAFTIEFHVAAARSIAAAVGIPESELLANTEAHLLDLAAGG